ncbi:MAG: dipeptidase [Chloroflexota bacterium]|nr:dipeptidase [Chloroflexota bacterium]
MAAWSNFLQDNESRFLEELKEFLRIPSISALPANAPDVKQAGEWVAARLREAGMEQVEMMPTGGHPVVYGEWLHAPQEPTILIYGHFDTQPVDPLELWDQPPFEPAIKNDRIYARGATDDKGNMLIPILAAEALLETEGKLPVNIKFFFEGQEEIGSPQLPEFLANHKDLLACDLVLNADAGQFSENHPGLHVGLRGICDLQIDVRGPDHDLHSGTYGGAVQNPIHALVQLLSSMRAPDGRILVDGFYDNVRPLTEEERKRIAAVPYDEEEYKEEIGVAELFGEPGYSTRERTWTRPTLEINGIYGGFQGEGTKTVLPSEAHAKITCRLVPDQDPDRISECLKQHIAAHRPPGVTIETVNLSLGAKPYSVPAGHPGNQAAADVLEEVYGVEPYYIRTGGTVPITSLFLEHLKAYSVSFAFGLPDERMHSPNEFFRLKSFRRGQRAYVLMLKRLAEQEL